ncbi:MAG: MBL fold metallo-hydrolase [Candidatus Bathyarchaeota archaeon]|jgi:ribonuclease J
MQSKTILAFYGGVNEVGGNKILLKDRDTKIFLDFGMPFALRSQFYSSPFLAPKSEKSLLEFGLLPKLSGIYESEESKPEIDAVFISHSHMDHAAYTTFLKRSIPVYCGETTKIILDALSKLRIRDLEFNVRDIQFKPFRTGDKIKIGSMEIEPVHVDHSVPGAYGFIVHTSSGSLAYTGDFRLHGTKPEMSKDFIEKAKESRPIAMIPEGTNMTGAETSSEPEVERKLTEIIKYASGIVLADFARADIDRFRSVYQASKRNKRTLVIPLKQAYLLEELKQKDKELGKDARIPNLSDDHVMMFQKTKKRYYKWEQDLVKRYETKIADASKISKMQSDVVLTLSFYELEELVEIKPKSGSCYILSASEPYDEEMHIDYGRMVNWLNHYGLPQYHVHISGHIMPLQLRETLQTVKPKRIFPIHGTHPELFSRFMKDLESNIVIVEKENEYGI